VIRVELIRAWRHQYESVTVEVADAAQVRDALAAAGWSLDADFIGLAVFGQVATLETRLHHGDRIELLRNLQLDPKQARRLRAERAKRKQPAGAP
jgi:putative ubiquitin-RnfH superfamily antitoxin RatB of RatAB toxin-antitoxin module